MPVRAVFLAVALLLGAGCDSAETPAYGFEATVATPGDVRTEAGSAAAGDALTGQFARFDGALGRGDQALTAISLASDDGDFHLLLGGLTSGPLAPGTYGLAELAFTGDPTRDGATGEGFIVMSLDGDPRDGLPALGFGTAGTVRIERADAEQVTGSFSVTTLSMAPGADAPAPPTAIEGRFTAEAGLR